MQKANPDLYLSRVHLLSQCRARSPFAPEGGYGAPHPVLWGWGGVGINHYQVEVAGESCEAASARSHQKTSKIGQDGLQIFEFSTKFDELHGRK